MRHQRFATILVGPSVLLLEGLSKVLKFGGFHIAASASSIDDLVFDTALKSQTVLLVIDIGDDARSVTKQIEYFKQEFPEGRVAMLADHDQLSSIVSAYRAGANAYLIKSTPVDSMIKSLQLVMLGETILPAAMLHTFLDGTPTANAMEDLRPNVQPLAKPQPEPALDDIPHLSSREKYVLNCLLGGDCNKSIARKLGIAEATVKVHVKAILRKIRVNNRTQAAVWAMNNVLPLG